MDLPQELYRRSKIGDENATSYLKKYLAMKDYLAKHYYPYIQANCPFFTDHGEAHINGVIWAASQLLRRSGSNESILTSFDIYLLLTSIIWHDVGMVSRRRGHEVEVRKYLDAVAEIAVSDVTEKRLVEEIIGAHTGRGTIQRLRQEERFGRFTVYPRSLAALLRFADEISEDSSRISQPLLKNGGVPEDHLIYWHYAACVKASHPDPDRERIILTIEIDRAQSVQELIHSYDEKGCPVKCTLIEYVIERVEKVVQERACCATHFLRHVSIQNVEVRLSLVNGTARVGGYDETFEFGSAELPEIQVSKKFFDENPRWKPDEIRKTP